MKKGTMIRILIKRDKYLLPPTHEEYSILLAKVIKAHKSKISVIAFDLFGSGKMKYISIDREEVISIV